MLTLQMVWGVTVLMVWILLCASLDGVLIDQQYK
jgi:hypothetical protein